MEQVFASNFGNKKYASHMPASRILGQTVAKVDSLNRVAREYMVEEKYAKNLGSKKYVKYIAQVKKCSQG